MGGTIALVGAIGAASGLLMLWGINLVDWFDILSEEQEDSWLGQLWAGEFNSWAVFMVSGMILFLGATIAGKADEWFG